MSATRWCCSLCWRPGWAVAEEGLPGRTAVFDDPITEGMNGLRLINPILMSHAPLDTVTIMLGTNDCKARFACDSYQIAQGIARLTKRRCRPSAGATTPTPMCWSLCRRSSHRNMTG